MFQRPSACSIFLKMESPPKMSHDSFTFRFPARLWRIINSCSTGAISWGPNGKTIRILRKKFEEEYLTGDAKPFKTAKYESFVRQLNHYGFKKVKKRSATKKITTPIMHGETKEEAAMLSEYHNPNFTRGKPERVTFLERRSQWQPETSGNKKRNKRGASAASEDRENLEDGTGKKTKRETSSQASNPLSDPETAGAPVTSIDDPNETPSSDISRPETVKNKNEQILSSRMECDMMTRHAVPPNRPPITLKPLPPVYAPPMPGSVRIDDTNSRRLVHHRPYYSGDHFEASFSDFPRFPPPLPSPWSQRPPLFGRPAQLCDDFVTAHVSSTDMCFGSFPPETRPLFMVRPGARRYSAPAMYPNERFIPQDAHNPWNTGSGLNRRAMVPMTDAYNDAFDSEHFGPVGRQRLRLPESVVNVPRFRRPPASRYFPADEPFLPPPPPPPPPQFEGLAPRVGLHARAPFQAANSLLMYATDADLQLHSKADFRGSFGHKPARENSETAAAFLGATGLWKVGETNRDRAMAKQASLLEVGSENNEKYILRIQSEGSDRVAPGSQQQGGRWVKVYAKNQEGASQNGYSEDGNVIAEDTTDLPLDVAEETVITCDSEATVTSDYTSPIMPYSSVEETIMIDTLMNTAAPLPPDDNTRPCSQRLCSSIETYSHCHSSTILSPSSSQCKLPDNSPASKEGSSGPYTPSSVWKYLAPDQFQVASADLAFQNDPAFPWTFTASRLLEETARIASANTTTKETAYAEESEAAEKKQTAPESEKLCAKNKAEVSAPDKSKHSSSSEAENKLSTAKVVMHREERGDLAHLSSTSVQELLSAALRAPGVEIMVDENYHPDKVAHVIPKDTRQEVNGCV